MKLLNLTTISILSTAFASLCADCSSNNEGSADQKQQQMYMDEMNKITPSADPMVTHYADPFLTADFIWWRGKEDGLEYAFNGLSNANTGAGAPGAPFKQADRGTIKRPHFDYEPGFKLGFGLKFRHDGWDFFSQYTWWRNDRGDSRSSIRRDTDNDSYVMVDIFCPSSVVAQGFFSGGVGQSGLIAYDAQRATGEWSMHFNALDLELGRNFWISKRLTLRPFVGMKFSWLQQKSHARFFGIFASNAFNSRLAMKLHEMGIGLRTGIDTAWYMCRGWSIFGNFAANGMYNWFESTRKDYFSNGVDPFQRIMFLRDKPKTLTAIFEYELGFRYEKLFCGDDYMFQLEAGWEQQIWFGQNQFLFMPTGTPGNLTFEGLTIKAGFYF